MQKRKFIRILLLPIGIIGVLVISLVVLFNYTLNTSVPFPYVPPPEGFEGDYIGTTVVDIETSFLAEYGAGAYVPNRFIGESFILKDTRIPTGALRTDKIETYVQDKTVGGKTISFIQVSHVLFMPQDPSDLEKLKAGDVVDIIGVCAGKLEEWQYNVVFVNCRFLPAGVVPLPLPGGPAVVIGGY